MNIRLACPRVDRIVDGEDSSVHEVAESAAGTDTQRRDHTDLVTRGVFCLFWGRQPHPMAHLRAQQLHVNARRARREHEERHAVTSDENQALDQSRRVWQA